MDQYIKANINLVNEFFAMAHKVDFIEIIDKSKFICPRIVFWFWIEYVPFGK